MAAVLTSSSDSVIVALQEAGDVTGRARGRHERAEPTGETGGLADLRGEVIMLGGRSIWQVLVGPGGLLRGWRRVQQRRGSSSSRPVKIFADRNFAFCV